MSDTAARHACVYALRIAINVGVVKSDEPKLAEDPTFEPDPVTGRCRCKACQGDPSPPDAGPR